MSKRSTLFGAAFLAVVFTALASASSVLAQAGSTGGTIGKQGKSVSGGEEAAPRRESAPTKPRQPKRRTSAEPGNRGAKREAAEATSADLNGQWRWNAKCDNGGPFNGIFNLRQSAGTFTGTFGGTNFWDNGTLSNGKISGNHVSFDREFLGLGHFDLSLSLGNIRGSLRTITGSRSQP